MQPDSYDAVREALAKLSLVGQMQDGDQLIVSAQEGPVWPIAATAFGFLASRALGI